MVAPDQLVARVAGDLAELVVDVRDGAVPVGDGDDRRLVEREAQVFQAERGRVGAREILGPGHDEEWVGVRLNFSIR